MKQIIPVYTFNAAARTVTFTEFDSIELKRILLITNVTDNAIIYNFAGSGGSVSGNVLTLAFNTTGMSNTDELSIQYETKPGDPDYSRVVNIETERKTWRRNFNGVSLDPKYWNQMQTGAGQTVNGGGGNLAITAGTTAAAETIIRSNKAFTVPFRVQFTELQSQRIAGNEFHLELVNASGDTYVGYMFDGTSATAAKTTHMNGGFSSPASPVAISTVTSSSPTTPVIREIEARADAVYFVDKGSDSTSGGTTRVVKTRSILNPDEEYYIQMRVKNTTAPATNTTYTIETILVQDMTKLVAEISGGRGNASANQAIPVAQQGTVSATVTTTSLGPSSSTSVAGLTLYRNAALLAVDVSVKTSAGKVYTYFVHNPNAEEAFIHFYNALIANVTVGSTAPVMTLWVPPNNRIESYNAIGLGFSTAITVAATTTLAGTTAPTNGLLVNIGFS